METTFNEDYFDAVKGKEIEKDILDTYNQGVEDAKEMAEEGALNKMPPLKGGKLELVVAGLTATFRESAARTKKSLQTGMESLFNSAEAKRAEKVVEKSKAEKEEKVAERKVISVELKRFKEGRGWLSFKITLGLMILLVATESVVDFNVFVGLDNILAAIAYSVGIAAIVGIVAHSFSRIVGLGKVLWQKVAIAACIFLLFFGMFSLIATVRVQQGAEIGLNASTTTRYNTLSNWTFVAINMGFFGAACLLSFGLPNRETRQKMQKRHELEKSLKRLNVDISALDTVIEKQEDLLEERKKMRDMIMNYQVKLLEWTESLYRKCVSIYIQDTSLKRLDGTPDCFDQLDELPPLFPNNKSHVI